MLFLPICWGKDRKTAPYCGLSRNKKGNWYPAAITVLTSWSPLLGWTSKPSLDPSAFFLFFFLLFPFLVDFDGQDCRTTNGLKSLISASALGLDPPTSSHLLTQGRDVTVVLQGKTTELQRQMCLACHCPRSQWLIHGESPDVLN